MQFFPSAVPVTLLRQHTMENDREKNTEESQDAEQGKDPSVKTSSKRKFVSQSQFNDLRTQVTGIQTEMAKLVALLQDPIAPANKKRKGALSLEGPENQFLADPTNDAGNEFATLQNGNQFASSLPGDQFPTLRDVEELDGQMPMAVSPMSLTSEITDGNFVPQFPNSLAQPPLTNVQLVEQQGVKLHFVEDEAVGPPISEANASYVEDCCKKRILSSELAKFKEAFKRPENCPALSVPTINPNLWAQLPKESKEHDKRLQNAQSLLAKGLTGVVQIKETLLHFNSHPDQFSLLFPKLFAELDSCVALLGNAFLESSYRRRDLLKPAINPRFHSLCGSKTPVTNFLFGDNVLESAKSIQSSQKMTRNFASGRGSFQTNRSTNRFSTSGSRTTSSNGNLNFRGQTHNSWRYRQYPRQSTSTNSFAKKMPQK